MADDSSQTARDRFARGILDSIDIAGTPTFGHFGCLNVLFLSRCRQRTVGYWDCYYQEAISPYLNYPGFRVINAAIRSAEGKVLGARCPTNAAAELKALGRANRDPEWRNEASELR